MEKVWKKPRKLVWNVSIWKYCITCSYMTFKSYVVLQISRVFVDRMKMYIFMFIEKMWFQCKHIISTLFTVMVTFPDTKYRDREKKAFQGFLAHSDKSLISLQQENFSPVSWTCFDGYCSVTDHLVHYDMWIYILFQMCPFVLWYYLFITAVTLFHFLIKCHFLKSESDEIIYCKLCTFVILVFSLSNHL